jgi:acetylornithine deacetylase/succinyl-diaminopimelate desuccinylase-like protein
VADRAVAQVLDWIDHRADEMADLLIRLVACETENPPGRALAECVELLGEEMDRLSLGPEIVELEPAGTLGEPRIVRGTVGNGESLVYFHSHFDVVPAQNRAQFTAERRDGKITGRGAADMKAASSACFTVPRPPGNWACSAAAASSSTWSATRRPAAPSAPGTCASTT